MPRSHSTSGDKAAPHKARRGWPLLAVTFTVAASYVALLRWGPKIPRPENAAAANTAPASQRPPELQALQAALERELLPASPLNLTQAWHALRGLGPRAPVEVQRLLRGAATQDIAPEAVPRWAGREPRVALSVTLLEGGAADPQGFALLDELPAEAEDAITLAFRLELAALAAPPPGPAAADPNRAAAQRRVAQLVTQGSKRLERREVPNSYAFARLAQAVFRSAAEGMTAPLMVQMRRLCGKLNAAEPAEHDPLLAAARLEALASFVWLSQRWEKAKDPRLSELLRRKRDELAQTLERDGNAGAANAPERQELVVAAVRALRLSQAVLSR